MKKFILILAVASILLIFGCTQPQESKITNFDECIEAGFPAMESYPRQCSDGENTFVEEIDLNLDTNYQTDGLSLIRNDNGTYVCVGCGETKSGEVICVDPIADANFVEETPEIYCDDFEVIKENVICPAVYQPVCGLVNIQCITTPCDPIQETFSNKCMLDAANAAYLYDGECVVKENDLNVEFVSCTEEQKQAELCTLEYMPVCGDNNITYGNICSACSSGQIEEYIIGEC